MRIELLIIVHFPIFFLFLFLFDDQIQFVAIMVHAFQLLFIDCNYPRAFVWWIGLHAVMFFFLFNEFYKNTYKYKMRKAAKLAAAANGANGTTNGSVNQYYDAINHNNQHLTNNNKKDFDLNSASYYGDNNELVNRKKGTVQN